MSLANPLWASLTSRHRALAQPLPGDALRYPADVAPFVAMEHAAPLRVDGDAYFIGPHPPDATPLGAIAQMICETSPPALEAADIVPLDTHEDAVRALAARVYPHYFRRRTQVLGRYFGIFADGVLAAMIGERMGWPGHREISAVCTHPDHTGRGLARRLLVYLARDLHVGGELPLLHVALTNGRAIDLYARNGFVTSRELTFARNR